MRVDSRDIATRSGTLSVSRTVPELRKFVEAGGTLLAIGSSTSIGYHWTADPERSNARQARAWLPCRRRGFIAIDPRRARGQLESAGVWSDRAPIFFDHSEAFRLRRRRAQA